MTCDAGERTSGCEDASVTEQTLARACDGDENAFRELTASYRRELQLHVYRIVGSGTPVIRCRSAGRRRLARRASSDRLVAIR